MSASGSSPPTKCAAGQHRQQGRPAASPGAGRGGLPRECGPVLSFDPSARRPRFRGRRRGRSARVAVLASGRSQASRCDGRASVTSGQRAAAGEARRSPQPPQRRIGRSAVRQARGRPAPRRTAGPGRRGVRRRARASGPQTTAAAASSSQPTAPRPNSRAAGALAARVHQDDADHGRRRPGSRPACGRPARPIADAAHTAGSVRAVSSRRLQVERRANPPVADPVEQPEEVGQHGRPRGRRPG